MGVLGQIPWVPLPSTLFLYPRPQFPLARTRLAGKERVEAPGQFGGIPLGAGEMPCKWHQVVLPISPTSVPCPLLQHLSHGCHSGWEDITQHVIGLGLLACGRSPRQWDSRQRTGPGGGRPGSQFLAPTPWLGHLSGLSMGKCGACPPPAP